MSDGTNYISNLLILITNIVNYSWFCPYFLLLFKDKSNCFSFSVNQ